MATVEADRAALAARHWDEVAAGLYAGLVWDPEGYERAVGLVGRLVAHLRETAPDAGALLDAADDWQAVVAAAVAEGSVRSMATEATLLAACAIRYRELRAAHALDRRRRAVLAAREQGASWAEVAPQPDVGVPGHHDGPGASLMVHVASGLGVVTTIEQDEASGDPLRVARPVAVDPETGALRPADPGLLPERRAATIEEHGRHLDELKRCIESLAAS